MDDTTKTEIRPLEIEERRPIYVYCTSYKTSRQLAHYGDIGYNSPKGRYTLVYVEEGKLEEIVKELKSLKFVKDVRVGHLKDLTENFSEAFIQTNLEIKKELGA